MFLPFPTLYRSRIQTRRKAVLLSLFATGLFITVTQMLRIQTIKQLTSYLNSAPVMMWGNVEANLGIIVTCTPTLAPLVQYFVEKTSRSGGATATTGANGGTGGRTTAAGARSSSYGLQSLPSSCGAAGQKAGGGGGGGGLVMSREASVTTKCGCDGGAGAGAGAGGNTAAGRKNNSYNESQESMLPRREGQPQGVIVKKTEVHMVHEAAHAV